MNKEIIQFDEVMDRDGNWVENIYDFLYWIHPDFILTCGDYAYYHCWDDDKEKGVLYRVKIKVCKECGRKI